MGTQKSSPFENLERFLSTKKGRLALRKVTQELDEVKELAEQAQKSWEEGFKKRWIASGKFDSWMNKMIALNGKARIKKCMKEGRQPSPTEGLSRTFSFIVKHGKQMWAKDLRKYSGGFPCQGWKYKDYIFLITFGQGTAYSVYKQSKQIVNLA